MNAKLTLTLEKTQIAEIKNHAKTLGQSVSDLAADLFRNTMQNPVKQPFETSEIVSGLRGSFTERVHTPRKKPAPKTAAKEKEE